MKMRKRVSKPKSRKMFKRGAKIHKKNMRRPITRGGIRL